MPTVLLSKNQKAQESEALQVPIFNEQVLDLLLRDCRRVFKIQSRRYLGNKFKLIEFIKQIVKDKCGDFDSFCDIFAGTGIVGYSFNNSNRRIISNELLYSNFISLNAWLSPENYDNSKMYACLDELNGLSPKEENYVSVNFGGTFFSKENARKAGAIRERIERLKLNFKEKSILLTSLLYAVDKVANTCGHYDAYRKKLDCVLPLQLFMPDIAQQKNDLNEIYNADANVLVNNINTDVLYIDPPYNSRQYSDAYHLLENIIRWNKPAVIGRAKKMNRSGLKSQYCIKGATRAFYELINNAKCKHILVSYNNTGESKDGRSNARISDDSIIGVLRSKGRVEIFEKEHKAFTAGRSEIGGHFERIFYCRVKK